MDITIAYTADFGLAPGGVHRYSTPLAVEGDDEWIVSFMAAGGEHFLAVSRPDGHGLEVFKKLLARSCGEVEYAQWLCGSVASILVDGRVFWVRPDQEEPDPDWDDVEGGEWL